MNIRILIVPLCTLAMALAAGCEREEPAAHPRPADLPTSTAQAVDPAARASNSPRVVFLGDSLTAGLGVDVEDAFPALVGEILRREARPVEVVNAGVSGDTTAGGLRRLDWLLRQKPDVVVVGLGGNDGLRGLELAASERNLRDIVRKSRDAGAKVLLLGMLIPPNYGPEYTGKFRDVYPRVATETGAALVPFVLEGVGGDPRLNQPDGIHPTAEGHRIMAATVVSGLRPLLPPAPPAQLPAAAPEPSTSRTLRP
jgi:acyl-CoA thioesterase-1